MKIVVDYDLCEANAVCMDVCPECFRVEEDDTLTILVEKPGEDLRPKVEEGNRGKVVAIDLETGSFEVAADTLQASERLLSPSCGVSRPAPTANSRQAHA